MKAMECLKPAFQGNNMCIVFCSDNRFMPATAVAMQSIIENASHHKQYDMVVLHTRIHPFMQEAVKQMAHEHANISIRFCDVGAYIGADKFYTKNRKSLTKEAYYRLILPWVLDDAYEYALYLDGDMIIRRDVLDIFDESLGDNLIGAVRDYWGICNCYMPGDDRRAYRQSIGLSEIDEYVISSTIIFNLRAFRNRFALEDVKALAVSKKWAQHDQDVINVLCSHSIHHLSAAWGWMSDYGNNHYLPQSLQDELAQVTDPYIVHFGGKRKPWEQRYADYDLDFWKYADHTPFFSLLLSKVDSMEYRNYVVFHITGGNIPSYCSEHDVLRSYKGVDLGKLSSGHTRYRAISIRRNTLHLEGMVGFFGTDLRADIQVLFSINGQQVAATKQRCENGYIKKKGITTYRGEAFELDYPLIPGVNKYAIKIVCLVDGIPVEKTNLGFERHAPLSRALRQSYYAAGDWMITTDTRQIYIQPYRLKSHLAKEYRFCKELWNAHKTPYRKAVFVRQAAALLKKLIRKPIWLISDRVAKADENGEAFFRYLCWERKAEVLPVFVIKKDCPDYERLKKIGKVVPIYSYRHKMLHLLAEYSISSQTDDVYKNPFFDYYSPYKDMLSDVGFVFLQHGIISNDLSDWLCRRRQNLKGFVTSAPREYDKVLNGNYDYSEKEIWLTGLPRFDMLEDRREKIITVLPTWRMYLATGQDPETGIWLLKDHFESTRYATFYRELLCSERLRKKLKAYGYTIQFKVHPSFLTYSDEFGFDEEVHIVQPDTSYREIYMKSSLIITDYSSAIYDFVYLKKPILYAQFDADEFFSGKHIYTKGYFDYERDGFGEVEYDLDGTIDRIIEYMENGCQMKDIYRERADRFFAFSDKNNCQRVYEKIRRLESGE